VLGHLRWLNGEFASVLVRALDKAIPLIEIADAGLSLGDDCHGQTGASTQALVKLLSPRLGDDPAANSCREFLDGAPSFFLNLWMAATKCIMRSAQGIAQASVVTAIGGNGFEFGVQLAGRPGHWVKVPALPPTVAAATSFITERALGAIGDSAVVDAFGLGAMSPLYAAKAAQTLATTLGPDEQALAPQSLMAEHPGFPLSGARTILAARTVCTLKASPIIGLGVLDKRGIEGRLSGGLYRPPVALFTSACDALRTVQ
jgi:hypothetical protein